MQGPAYEAGTPEDVPQGLGWTPPRGLNILYVIPVIFHMMLCWQKPKKQFLDLMQLLADDQSCWNVLIPYGKIVPSRITISENKEKSVDSKDRLTYV